MMVASWIDAISQLNSADKDFVLVTLLATKGSTPRNAGTKMVITQDDFFDSIGGGNLEYQVIALARKILADSTVQHHIGYFPLGPSLGQCCGGSTAVLFEKFTGSYVYVMLFGAGHVGKALVSILSELPCKVHWVDSRENEFPVYIPSNVTLINIDQPEAAVSEMPVNSYYLVMTHNHQLDFLICEEVLKKSDFSYLGLIGSKNKWRRFQQRLKYKNFSEEVISRIQCPIGLCEVPGKRPMEVAVSIAGEIINHYQKKQLEQKSVNWQELKHLYRESGQNSLSETNSN
ncbi:xanthine dehydrogenase accessory protein XdhC [Zooshikella ganghwensis]|uniref:Xanthine dehydrogenase accessory protein XdhC n=1 Tax=Zooshikella ganghwensis TaxID=202772 RepID=A0A4P9VUJ0_9GAMM|nr:xanthine dehydrogenase accessory protein XdhC [Zooshikella ganghwensis]RDH45570.1 xanthine dehydrogenase accessory protein XdhC [Zooshikella ganghwensis]